MEEGDRTAYFAMAIAMTMAMALSQVLSTEYFCGEINNFDNWTHLS